MFVVADTSALVSLGTVTRDETNPLDYLLGTQDVVLPQRVVTELEETAAYDDVSGRGAASVLDRRTRFDVRSIDLDETFPLDNGENAAVTLANDIEAGQFLCDEFNRLALIHASLTTARLLTTPTLLAALSRAGVMSDTEAMALLSEVSDARSWTGNSYVDRVRTMLTG